MEENNLAYAKENLGMVEKEGKGDGRKDRPLRRARRQPMNEQDGAVGCVQSAYRYIHNLQPIVSGNYFAKSPSMTKKD